MVLLSYLMIDWTHGLSTSREELSPNITGTLLVEFGLGDEIELSPTSARFGQTGFKTSLRGGVKKRDSTYLSTCIEWS